MVLQIAIQSFEYQIILPRDYDLRDIKLVIDAFALAGVRDRYDTIIYLDMLKM